MAKRTIERTTEPTTERAAVLPIEKATR